MLGTIKEELALCRERFQGVEAGALVRCCHHDTLVELLIEPPENRITYIMAEKPKAERARRLHEFWPIPRELMPPRVAKACAELAKARAEWCKARTKLGKARAKLGKARAEWDKSSIIALVPDTMWDGKTIFPRDRKKVLPL